MRSLRQPGPAAAGRAAVAPCIAMPLKLALRAGRSVNEAVTGALAEAGFDAGYVHLRDVAVAPMRYVIPAPAPDRTHAAWYSGTFAPEGTVRIEEAGVIAGSRDGAPFIHCHGVWLEPGGSRRAGHLLPHDSLVAEDAEVDGWGISGATFAARDDEETNFRLFRAEAAPGVATAGRAALAATLRPNGDLSLAIEEACRTHGFDAASIHGIGSLVGVDFADGRHVPSYATEVFVTGGGVAAGRATLDVALVALDGTVHAGRLAHGTNPVCITFELLLVAA